MEFRWETDPDEIERLTSRPVEEQLASGIALVYRESQDAAARSLDGLELDSLATIIDGEDGSFTVTPGKGAPPEWQRTFRVTVTTEEV